MKHSKKITLILIASFFVAQLIGLGIIYNYIDHDTSSEGKVVFEQLPIGERPEVQQQTSFLYVIFAILIGTGILLLLIKFSLFKVWKAWFFIAAIITLTVAFGSIMPTLVAFILALVLSAWKVFKPGVLVHNITELFIYGGLAAIFVPMFNLVSGIILLVLISIYDMYAVWKSKHMVTMAKSMTKAKVFAGMMIPYKMPKKVKKVKKKSSKTKVVSVKTAILGGGDIGFPIIFAGILMKTVGMWAGVMISVCATIALALLFWKSEDKKFYPAMPFISAGCFVGLGVVWLVRFIL